MKNALNVPADYSRESSGNREERRMEERERGVRGESQLTHPQGERETLCVILANG